MKKTFNWQEYLELAKHLTRYVTFQAYSEEAAQRSAVSRAYYAAFCTARNYAEAHLGFQRRGGPEDHKLLRECLRREEKLDVASTLNRLRGWRNNCDYDDVVPNLTYFVQNAIQSAEKVIGKCR